MLPRTAPNLGRPTTIHEPSAWLRGAAAKRARQIRVKFKGIDIPADSVIVAPLGRAGALGSRADRECDRCFAYVPPGDLLYLFVYQPTPRINLCCGLCATCERKELNR